MDLLWPLLSCDLGLGLLLDLFSSKNTHSKTASSTIRAMSDPAKFKILIAELKAEYYLKMPERVASLEAASQQKDEDRLEELFHNYKGTGKTHGLPELSILCDAVENFFLHKNQERFTAAELAIEILQELYLRTSAVHDAEVALKTLENHPHFQRILALQPRGSLKS